MSDQMFICKVLSTQFRSQREKAVEKLSDLNCFAKGIERIVEAICVPEKFVIRIYKASAKLEPVKDVFSAPELFSSTPRGETTVDYITPTNDKAKDHFDMTENCYDNLYGEISSSPLKKIFDEEGKMSDFVKEDLVKDDRSFQFEDDLGDYPEMVFPIAEYITPESGDKNLLERFKGPENEEAQLDPIVDVSRSIKADDDVPKSNDSSSRNFLITPDADEKLEGQANKISAITIRTPTARLALKKMMKMHSLREISELNAQASKGEQINPTRFFRWRRNSCWFDHAFMGLYIHYCNYEPWWTEQFNGTLILSWLVEFSSLKATVANLKSFQTRAISTVASSGWAIKGDFNTVDEWVCGSFGKSSDMCRYLSVNEAEIERDNVEVTFVFSLQRMPSDSFKKEWQIHGLVIFLWDSSHFNLIFWDGQVWNLYDDSPNTDDYCIHPLSQVDWDRKGRISCSFVIMSRNPAGVQTNWKDIDDVISRASDFKTIKPEEQYNLKKLRVYVPSPLKTPVTNTFDSNDADGADEDQVVTFDDNDDDGAVEDEVVTFDDNDADSIKRNELKYRPVQRKINFSLLRSLDCEKSKGCKLGVEMMPNSGENVVLEKLSPAIICNDEMVVERLSSEAVEGKNSFSLGEVTLEDDPLPSKIQSNAVFEDYGPLDDDHCPELDNEWFNTVDTLAEKKRKIQWAHKKKKRITCESSESEGEAIHNNDNNDGDLRLKPVILPYESDDDVSANGESFQLSREILNAFELLSQCNNALFVTGAGISVSSGIPSFRGKGGIYTDGTMRESFFDYPSPITEEFLSKHFDFASSLVDKMPSQFHEFVASLCQEEKIFRVLNQNVDGLFTSLDMNGKLVNVHGDYSTVVCSRCGTTVQRPFTAYPRGEFSLCQSVIVTRNGTGRVLPCNSDGKVGKNCIIPGIFYYKDIRTSPYYPQEVLDEIETKGKGVPDLIVLAGISFFAGGMAGTVKCYAAKTDCPILVINNDESLEMPVVFKNAQHLVISADDFAEQYLIWQGDQKLCTDSGTISDFVEAGLRDSYVCSRKLDLKESQVEVINLESHWDCDAILLVCEAVLASTVCRLPLVVDDKGSLSAISKERKTKLEITFNDGSTEEVAIDELETFKIGELVSSYGMFDAFLVLPIRSNSGDRKRYLEIIRLARVNAIQRASELTISMFEKAQLLSLPHNLNTTKGAQNGKCCWLSVNAAACFWDSLYSCLDEPCFIFVRMINCKDAFAFEDRRTLQSTVLGFLKKSFSAENTIIFHIDVCRTYYGTGGSKRISICPSRVFAEKFIKSSKYPLFLTWELANFQGKCVKNVPEVLVVNVYNNYKKKVMPFNRNVFAHSPVTPMKILNNILFGPYAELLLKATDVSDFEAEVQKVYLLLEELKGMSTGMRVEFRCSLGHTDTVLDCLANMVVEAEDFLALDSAELFEYVRLNLWNLASDKKFKGQMIELLEQSLKSDIIVNALFHGRLYGGICRSELIRWTEISSALQNFNHMNLPVFLKEGLIDSPSEQLTVSFLKSLARFWPSRIAKKVDAHSSFFERLYFVKFRSSCERKSKFILEQYSQDLNRNIFSEMPAELEAMDYRWTGTKAVSQIFDVKKLDYDVKNRGQFFTPSMLLYLCFINSTGVDDKVATLARIVDEEVIYVHYAMGENFFGKSNKYVWIQKKEPPKVLLKCTGEVVILKDRVSTKSTEEEIASAPKLDIKYRIRQNMKKFGVEIVEAALCQYLAEQCLDAKGNVTWSEAVKVNHFACGKSAQALRDMYRKIKKWSGNSNGTISYKKTQADSLSSTLDINDEMTALSLWSSLE
jgi:NAD-dependent SIR2 family protein deacetylase